MTKNIFTTADSKPLSLNDPYYISGQKVRLEQMSDENDNCFVSTSEVDSFWCSAKNLYAKMPNKLKDNDDIQGLVSEIINVLQYQCKYLKPQPKSTAGNVQGDGIYNWEAHNELENLIKERFKIND